jgi:hypothetical protein
MRLAVVVVVSIVLAATIAAALRRRSPQQQVLVPRAADLDSYVGAAKCAACHREIYDRQSQSRMAHALETAGEYHRRHDLALPAEVTDQTNDLVYRVEARQGQLFLEVSRGQETARGVMAYALGSGQRGLSFVRERDPENYEELRLSYFADTRSWDLTPGQESDRPASIEDALGRPVPKRSPAACLTCHASWLVQSEGRIDVASSRFGVDCERCHGPGRDHVRTAMEGAPAQMQSPALSQALVLTRQWEEGLRPESRQDEILQSVARAGDDRLVRDLYVCGECHGRRQMLMDPDDGHLARFQVAALLASRCYQRSAQKLRCTDCHDPHGDAVHGDERPYVAVCLRCHSAEPAVSPASSAATGAAQAKVCPKNPRAGCIGCHMPVRSPMYRSHFTQHRIGLYAESVLTPPLGD